MGDSITEQHLYSNYLEAWTLMRFPAWKITFHNVGIGGDTSRGGNGRFVRDVAEYKPTALTVDFGMNDGGYRAFDQSLFDNYMAGLAGIAKQAKEAKLRVAWITPSPVEKNEDGPAIEGYNRTLEKFSEGVKKVAAENGGLFVDQFHPCVAVEDKARAAKPSNRMGGGDAVHFGPPGQAVMASAILKGMSFPTLVAAVEIDASGKVGKSDNCTITEATATSGGVKFTQLDQALPFFPTEAAAILTWSPILEEMNQYTLKVTGLAEGKYDVQLGRQDRGAVHERATGRRREPRRGGAEGRAGRRSGAGDLERDQGKEPVQSRPDLPRADSQQQHRQGQDRIAPRRGRQEGCRDPEAARDRAAHRRGHSRQVTRENPH